MRVVLDIGRFNPDAQDAQPYRQEFVLEVEEYFTVLDALIRIREFEDPSLAVRCSCRASICGSCAMRVNGHAGLGCKTKLISVMDKEGRVRVDPVGNMPLVKDLVWDMKPFWDKVRAVEPYLQPEGPEPEEEYIASAESMLHLVGVQACIMCGACVSDCTVLEVDKNFLGPAALAKAYRFIGDPRDGATKARLEKLNEYSGVWDCTRCMECVQACPKGVAPMERIMVMRDKAIANGLHGTNGARHAESFAEMVKHTGWLNEFWLVPRTYGMFNLMNLNSMFGALPVAWRAWRRGKLPSMMHPKREGAENVRRIFEKVEDHKS
ncbi:MAG: succinate dehydrogenase iron-sulfur subunit [Chloroflexi bacterium]|nr:succinate dehydrogenase iron-sulfur subunit [Chloroflexota bacterium]